MFPAFFFYFLLLLLRIFICSRSLSAVADLGCRYLLLLISILDLQYSVFKVRSAQNKGNGQGKLAFLWSVALFCIACLHAMSSKAANAEHNGIANIPMGLSGPFLLGECLLLRIQAFLNLLGLSGLEPPTSRLSGVRSNRLSYKPRLIMQVRRHVALYVGCLHT